MFYSALPPDKDGGILIPGKLIAAEAVKKNGTDKIRYDYYPAKATTPDFPVRVHDGSARVSRGQPFDPPSVRVGALMKLDLRLRMSGQPARQCSQGGLRHPVQRPLVHLVERSIHPSSKYAFDEEIASEGEVHEIADRAHAAERHERAEVAVDVWL